jgi:nucleoid-associated protein YgaU
MKSRIVLITAILVSLPCFAQRLPGVSPVGTGGFGNVLHPGTGNPVPKASSSRPAQLRRPLAPVYGYSLYTGGTYIPSYAPDYSPQTQIYSPQQQYAPQPVIINQYFAPPAAQEPVTFYQPAAERQTSIAEEPAPVQNKYYLVAFKDHSAYSALAYWIEGETLHYVTTRNTHNQASLDLVDLDFTKQLNGDRAQPQQ